MAWFLSLATVLLIGSIDAKHLFAAGGYVVIVNKANPVSSLSESEVSRYFLKKSKTWNDGVKVEPMDLAEKHRVRQRFSQDIHGRVVSAIKSYWRQQVFSGRSAPPAEVRLEGDVLGFVSNIRGAIGYVSEDTPIGGAFVKRIRVTN